MEYSIPEINDGVAKVVYSDGSWVLLTLAADMTEADLDDIVYQIAPPSVKAGETPSFLSSGSTRTASKKPIPEPEEWVDPRPQWLQDRQTAYGTLESQIEFITENGLDAWIAKVAQIKADNPKT